MKQSCAPTRKECNKYDLTNSFFGAKLLFLPKLWASE